MGFLRFPRWSKEKPAKRGDQVKGDGGNPFVVAGSKKIECKHCEGHGWTWEIRLRSKYGPVLIYPMDFLNKWGYKVERAGEKPGT